MYLGVRKILWLEDGLVGDETDGHVDNVARFVAPGRMLCAVASAKDDPSRDNLLANLARLSTARDARGRAPEIIELPLPAPRAGPERPLALSYLNFYICNDGIILPSFEDPMDEVARGIVADVFPERSVRQIPALTIARGGGGIHCMTQQQPATQETVG